MTTHLSPSFHDVLSRCNVDQLKHYHSLLSSERSPLRKGELVAAVARHFDDSAALCKQVEALDPVQRDALAFAAHLHHGQFKAQAFAARYGTSPAFTVRNAEHSRRYFSEQPNLLHLLFGAGSGTILGDLRARLKPLLLEPAPMQIQALTQLPTRLDGHALTIRICENEALRDLAIVLRLADAGKLTVSEKTGLASGATRNLLAEQLHGGDYYPLTPPKNDSDQEIGAIKGFSWPQLVQVGKLVERQGKRLVPTARGRKALGAPIQALQALWQAWSKQNRFDEFSRIDTIKGQNRGRGVMTALAPRRATIMAALACCPVGEWVEADALSRYMQAEGFEFEVCHDPWKLYICDPHYGSLGYSGFHDWHILQGRYLRCLLLEYAAPLGLIDVAYIHPEHAPRDFNSLWGCDDLSFLSRYDGLCYLRLTPLGAFILEMNASYQATRPAISLQLAVQPNGHIQAVAGDVGAEERVLLENWAVPDGENAWRLERAHLLGAVERGQDVAELLGFLSEREDQPLPEPVEAMIRDCAKRGRALQMVSQVQLIACESADLADTLADHAQTRALCQRSGERHLVVLLRNEKAFREALRVLGYGMAD